MTACLIISSLAEEYEQELAAIPDLDIEVSVCKTAKQALQQYRNQTVVFGDPDLVAPILSDLPGIDWVQSTWAGVLPFIRAKRRDYTLTGVKGVFGSQMSEFVLGYLLAHELRIFARQQAQQKKEWYRAQSEMLAGKCLGVMGTGSIGRHIARTAAAFGMRVNGLSRSGKALQEFDTVFPIAKLDRFLESVDHLVATLPQTPDTDDLLNAGTLARLSSDACFINVGRSNVVDNDALIAALASGELGGAVLDVFDREPLPEDSPLWQVPKLLITAHISAVSHPSLVVPIFAEYLRRYQAQQAMKYAIDFETGY